MKKVFAAVILLFVLAGCTDAQRAQLGAYGDPATVKCYSAEAVIYEGRSTGKVSSPESSDGYLFMDASTGRLTEVSGNCVVTYGR